jgi:hypothetical protein
MTIPTEARIAIRTVDYCAAHYPLLLDGEAVLCTREPGHEGPHQRQDPMFGDIMQFEDQPECWDTTPIDTTIYVQELNIRRRRLSDGMAALSAVSMPEGNAVDQRVALDVLATARSIVDAQIAEQVAL